MQKKNYHSFIYILFFFFLITIAGCQKSSNNQEETDKPYLIMLSFDGFRWDYPKKVETPNFDFIEKNGVKAKGIKSCFPTKTFPNHYSMATGLYPDNHGIVQNNFFDPKTRRSYAISNREAVQDGYFYGGEPIWVTAEKQGMNTATLFWVGSEAKIKGIRPQRWKPYNHNMPYEDRVDTIINWLSLPEKQRPQLVLGYFPEPDWSGHEFGPDSKEIEEKIKYVDKIVGLLLKKIKTLPNHKNINLIVTSDHGMGAISNERGIALSKYVKEKWCKNIKGGNPVYLLQEVENCGDSIYNSLKNVEHLSIYKNTKIPEYWHYGKNPRVTDWIVVADSSWSIFWKKPASYERGGTHGYDNRNTDMHAIFYAIGNQFKKGYKQPLFDNIDLYPLIAKILKLSPVKVDGKLENTEKILTSYSQKDL